MSLTAGIFASILLCIVVCIFITEMLRMLYIRHEKIADLSDEEPIMDQVFEESYNGRPLWIKPEEREAWSSLNREMKRKVVMETEKRIKKGELYVHTDETGFTGLITRKEAIEKGYIKDEKTSG